MSDKEKTEGSSRLEKFGTDAYVLSRKTIKGIVLISWIAFLIYIAILASSGGISKILVDFTAKETMSNANTDFQLKLSESNISPLDFYKHYSSTRNGRQARVKDIPVLMLLNEVFSGETKWIDYRIEKHYSHDTIEITSLNKWKKRQYEYLFSQGEHLLLALVSQRSADVREITIPKHFYPTPLKSIAPKESNLQLSAYLKHWVKDKVEQVNFERKRDTLIDTFFILLVLGAFGSLIFLTRDFINKESKTNLESYLFRPILGMFLAMGMFVLDLLVHVLISTSSVNEVRVEPLYVLALASGLLSEQAYEIMSTRAQDILEKNKND